MKTPRPRVAALAAPTVLRCVQPRGRTCGLAPGPDRSLAGAVWYRAIASPPGTLPLWHTRAAPIARPTHMLQHPYAGSPSRGATAARGARVRQGVAPCICAASPGESLALLKSLSGRGGGGDLRPATLRARSSLRLRRLSPALERAAFLRGALHLRLPAPRRPGGEGSARRVEGERSTAPCPTGARPQARNRDRALARVRHRIARLANCMHKRMLLRRQ